MTIDRTRLYTDMAGTTREGLEPWDAKECALRDGRAYLASTGIISAAINESVYVILSNPANSGRGIFIDERWFDNNRASDTTPIEYTAFLNPTATLSQSAVSSNLRIGNGANSAAVGAVTWQAGSGITMGDTQGSAAPLPTGGIRQTLQLALILAPGNRLGFRIDGGGQNLQQAARIAMTFVWHEEVIT